MAEQVELVQRMMELFNEGHAGRLGEVLDPDCEFVHPMASLRGAEQVAGFLSGSLRAFPGMRHELTSVVADGDVVMAELTWSGTHTGPLAGPGGEIPPTGRSAVVPVAGVFVCAGGRVTSVRYYFDRLALLEQLGLVPASAGA